MQQAHRYLLLRWLVALTCVAAVSVCRAGEAISDRAVVVDSRNVAGLTTSGPLIVTASSTNEYGCTVTLNDGALVTDPSGLAWSVVSPAPDGALFAGNRLLVGSVTGEYWFALFAGYVYPANGASNATRRTVGLANGVGVTYAVASCSADTRNIAGLAITGPEVVAAYSTNGYSCVATLTDGTAVLATTGASWRVDGNVPVGTGFVSNEMVVARVRGAHKIWVCADYVYPVNGARAVTDLRVTATGYLGVASATAHCGADSRNVSGLELAGPWTVTAYSTNLYTCVATLNDGSEVAVGPGGTWSLEGVVPTGTVWVGQSLIVNRVNGSYSFSVRVAYVYPPNGAGKGTVMTVGAYGNGGAVVYGTVPFDADTRRVASVAISGPAVVSAYSTNDYECAAFLNDGTELVATTGASWTVQGVAPTGTQFQGRSLVVGRVSGDYTFLVRAGYVYGPNGASNASVRNVSATGGVGVVYASASFAADTRNVADVAVSGPTNLTAFSTNAYQCTARLSDGTEIAATTGAVWRVEESAAPVGAFFTNNVLVLGRVTATRVFPVYAQYVYAANGATRSGSLVATATGTVGAAYASAGFAGDARNVVDLAVYGPEMVAGRSTNAYVCVATLNDGLEIGVTTTGVTWSVDAWAPTGTVFVGNELVVGPVNAERRFGVHASYVYPANGAAWASELSVTATGAAGVAYAAASFGVDTRNVSALTITGNWLVATASTNVYGCMAMLNDGSIEAPVAGTVWASGALPAGTVLESNRLIVGLVATHTWVVVTVDYTRPINGASGRGMGGVLIAAWDDAYETNNVWTAAYDLSGQSGVWLSGHRGSGSQLDDDWYLLSVPAGAAELAVTCRFSNVEGDIDLRLTDGSGALVATSAGQGDEERITVARPQAGNYYLQVYGQNRGNGYDLAWNTAELVQPTGWLQVMVEPAAVSGRWAVAGGPWNGSGATVGLAAGAYVVGFETLDGWIEPAVTQVVVLAGATQAIGAAYTRQVLQAGFEVSPQSGVVPLSVLFQDRSVGQILTWDWDLDGDGWFEESRSNAVAVSVTYTNAGTYTVGLRVSGPAGTNTMVKSGAVHVLPPPPVAEFSASPLRGPAGMTVTFTNQSQGEVTSALWDFDGDGVNDLASLAATVQHGYTSTQSFSVRLTVLGPYGSNSMMKSGYITTVAPSSSNRAPVLVVARRQIFLDSLSDLALLDAGDSFDPDGDALCFSWRELPGNPAHGLIPIGSESLARLPLYFPEPGRYEFEIRIGDGLDVCPEGQTITVYVPGIKGVTRLGRTSGLVNVPDVRVAVYASESDAQAGTNPVDVAVSDSQGRFVLEGVSPASVEEGRSYYVREDAEGFATNEAHLVTVWPDPSGKPESLYEWSIRRGTVGYLRGVVCDLGGAAIEGADVWLSMGVGLEVKAARTSADGTFGLPYVPMGSWTLQVRASGFESQALDVHVGSGLENVHVRLAPAGVGRTVLRGRVTSAGLNLPVAGASVVIGTAYSQTTDEQGFYEFGAGLPVGVYEVTVLREGFVAQRLNQVWVKGATQSVDVVLYAGRQALVAGTVVDAVSGRPVRLATVGLEGLSGTLIRSDVSDCTGYFEIEDVPEGSNQLFRVAAPGYAPKAVWLTVSGSLRIGDIRMTALPGHEAPQDPAGWATQVVARLSQTNVYLANLKQTAWLDGRPSKGLGLAYVWSESPNNPASLLPAGSEYMDRIQLSGFTKPGVYHYTLRVMSGGRLSANTASMTVFAPGLAGQAYASPSDGIVGVDGVVVRAYAHYADALANTGYRDSKLTGVVPVLGAFTLDSLSTGEYWVVARSVDGEYKDYGPVKKRVNYCAAGGRMGLNLPSRRYPVSGFVVGLNKIAMGGVRVMVAPGMASETFRTTTDTNGAFRLNGVPGGAQMLSFMKDGYETLVCSQSIGESTPVLTLVMRASPTGSVAWLRGRVTTKYKGLVLPVPNVEVVVGAGVARAFTDADGYYVLGDLVPGDYRVTLRKAGYVSCWLDDDQLTGVRGGANLRNKEMKFEDRGPQVRGLVVDSDGTPVHGARVSVLTGGSVARSSQGKSSGTICQRVDLAWERTGAVERSGRTLLAAGRTVDDLEPDVEVRRLGLRDTDGTVRTVLASEAAEGDGAGVFQLAGVPDGDVQVLVELASGTRFVNRMHVSGTMETVLQIPLTSEPYESWVASYFENAPADTEDSDGDGVSNRKEYLAGTDPTRRDSVFEVSLTRGANNEFWLGAMNSSASRVYDVWRSTNLVGDWTLVASNLWGNDQSMWFVATNETDRAWFRVNVRVP